jgi:hypothetical protein
LPFPSMRGQSCASQPKGICFGGAFSSAGWERRHSACLLKPNVGVELFCEHGLKIMAKQLAFRPICHTPRRSTHAPIAGLSRRVPCQGGKRSHPFEKIEHLRRRSCLRTMIFPECVNTMDLKPVLSEVVPLLFGLDVLRRHLRSPYSACRGCLFDRLWERTVRAAAIEAAQTVLGADDGRHRFRRESIAAAPWARVGRAGH